MRKTRAELNSPQLDVVDTTPSQVESVSQQETTTTSPIENHYTQPVSGKRDDLFLPLVCLVAAGTKASHRARAVNDSWNQSSLAHMIRYTPSISHHTHHLSNPLPPPNVCSLRWCGIAFLLDQNAPQKFQLSYFLLAMFFCQMAQLPTKNGPVWKQDCET